MLIQISNRVSNLNVAMEFFYIMRNSEKKGDETHWVRVFDS